MDTRLGRYHVAEPPSSLRTLHLHDGGTLKAVDHEPKVAVLDQEDLLAQGIHTSKLVPGAADVDALGSCVPNTATEALSNALDGAAFTKVTGAAISDAAGAEEYAIRLYHATTDLTGDPSSEWPPTDCGSTGLYVCKELEKTGVISGHRTAHGADNIVSLMQSDGLLVGQPWFNSWFQPDAHGFIDGDGSIAAFEEALASGVAGGHETYWSAIEHLELTATGRVDPAKTIIRFRNHWTASFGDNGSGRVHLSTFVMLGGNCDWRQFTVAA